MERRKAPSTWSDHTYDVFLRAAMKGFVALVGVGLAILVFWQTATIDAVVLPVIAQIVVGAFFYLRDRPAFRCPQCGKVISRRDTTISRSDAAICFICSRCQI